MYRWKLANMKRQRDVADVADVTHDEDMRPRICVKRLRTVPAESDVENNKKRKHLFDDEEANVKRRRLIIEELQQIQQTSFETCITDPLVERHDLTKLDHVLIDDDWLDDVSTGEMYDGLREQPRWIC